MGWAQCSPTPAAPRSFPEDAAIRDVPWELRGPTVSRCHPTHLWGQRASSSSHPCGAPSSGRSWDLAVPLCFHAASLPHCCGSQLRFCPPLKAAQPRASAPTWGCVGWGRLWGAVGGCWGSCCALWGFDPHPPQPVGFLLGEEPLLVGFQWGKTPIPPQSVGPLQKRNRPPSTCGVFSGSDPHAPICGVFWLLPLPPPTRQVCIGKRPPLPPQIRGVFCSPPIALWAPHCWHSRPQSALCPLEPRPPPTPKPLPAPKPHGCRRPIAALLPSHTQSGTSREPVGRRRCGAAGDGMGRL